MSRGQCYSLLYGRTALPHSLPWHTVLKVHSCCWDTIISASSNRENEIEMHSARLRPLSRSPELSRSFPFCWKKTGVAKGRGGRMVRLSAITLPLNISIRVYCVCRIYRRTLPTPWIVRQRWFCSQSRRRPRKRRRATGSAGGTVWFSFHGDPSPSCPLCKEYTPPRRMRKLRDIVKWRVNERPRASSSGIWDSRETRLLIVPAIIIIHYLGCTRARTHTYIMKSTELCRISRRLR